MTLKWKRNYSRITSCNCTLRTIIRVKQEIPDIIPNEIQEQEKTLVPEPSLTQDNNEKEEDHTSLPLHGVVAS